MLPALAPVVRASLVILTAIGPPDARAKADTLISFIAGDRYAAGIDTAVVIPIPILLRSRDASIRASVIDVALDGHRSEPLLGMFTARIEAPKQSDDGRLLLSAPAPAKLTPGTYDVVVLVWAAPSETNGVRYSLKITLEAATLAPIASLTIAQTLPWLFFMDPRVSGGVLRIDETGGYTRVASPVVRQVDAAGPDGVPVAGRLAYNVREIAAKGSTMTAAVLNGDFPLGKTTVSLEITASQLKAPVPLKVEVTTKRDPLAILWIAALGLLAGVIIRVLLTFVIQRSRTRIDGHALLRRIGEEATRRRDEELRKKLTDLATDVRDALAEAKEDDRKTRLQNARQQLDVLLSAFRTNLTDVARDIDTYSRTYERVWSVPEAFAPAVVTLANGTVNARTLLGESRPTAARRVLDDAKKTASSQIVGAARAFEDRVSADVAALNSTPFANDELRAATRALEQAPLIPAGPSADAALVLDAVHERRARLGFALQVLARAVTSAVRLIVGPLSGLAALPDHDEIDRLGAFADATAGNIRAGAAAPEEAPIQEYLSALETRVSNTFAAEYPAKPTEDQKAALSAIGESLKRKAFAEAAAALAALYRPRAGCGFMSDDASRRAALTNFGLTAEALGEETTALAEPKALSAAVRNVRTSVIDAGPYAAQDDAREVARLSWSLLFAQLAQSALIGILIVFAGYLIYSRNFVGTAADVGAVFFWAFSLDVTVATLVSLGGRVAPSH